uniref:Histone deacetylase 10 n=1 Tax=Nothobranchius kadleci TaxID=1051664 RepID=A0A1A8CMN0_NOTKA
MAHGTALIYDEEMTKYKLLWVDPACKIEVPERLSVSYEALVRNGLADRCVSIPVREATDAEILLVHSDEYLEAVKKTPYMTLEDLKEFTLQFGDVYFHPNIYRCAKLAAGSALQLVDSVMMERVRNGMALVRPPGHHSMRSAASGFCVFNNVAIAARYAKQKYGVKRVLIVDWDIHHGFDSAIGDPEGEMCATPDIFAHLTHLLMNLAGGRLCAVLEGGYNLTSLPQSVCQTVQTLLGDPLPQLANLSGPCRSALESLQCLRSAQKQYWGSLKHTASPTAANISTKRIRIAEGEVEEEEKTELGEEEKNSEEKVWHEPPKRPCPPIRAASVLPDDVACPDGCKRITKDIHPLIVSRLKDHLVQEAEDGDALATFSTLVSLVQKMEKNEVGSGLALVGDVIKAMMCVVQHVSPDLNRVLVVCVGNGKIPSHISRDGKVLVLQISSDVSEEQQSKHYISVCLQKGCCNTSGFMQAILGLLLPVGYEYNPDLVVLVRMPDSGVCDVVWKQLTGLLQSFAKGHTLVLMQEKENSCVGPTASILLGDPAPPLETLQAPDREDVDAVERLRRRLQADWKLLQTTSEYTSGAVQH